MLLPFGRSTVLESVLERLEACKAVDEQVLATTDAPADDALADLARARGVRVVRGSEEDVVDRMRLAVEAFDAPPAALVRACADNPLVMPSVVDAAVEQLFETGVDLVTPFEQATYPFGFGLVAMTRDCLARIDREASDSVHREHVENFCFDHPERFRIGYQVAPEALCMPELVVTLDHACDLERLRRLERRLAGLPLAEQPAALIESLRGAALWVEGQSGGDPSAADLIVLQRPRDGMRLRPAAGVVTLDVQWIEGGERHVLRYA
ncbi:MAG: NTP transferase domain-containing protein, partial [Planctomycetota bacterium]